MHDDEPADDRPGSSGKARGATGAALPVVCESAAKAKPGAVDALACARETVPLSNEEAIIADLPDWRGQFVIALFALAGNLTLACRLRKVSRSAVHEYRKADPVFDGWVKLAQRAAGDLIKGALMVSATVGDLHPIFQGGVHVGNARRKSVKAAVALLAAERPEYRAGGGEATTSNNNTGLYMAVSIATTTEGIQRLTDAAAARLFGARPAAAMSADDLVPVLD